MVRIIVQGLLHLHRQIYHFLLLSHQFGSGSLHPLNHFNETILIFHKFTKLTFILIDELSHFVYLLCLVFVVDEFLPNDGVLLIVINLKEDGFVLMMCIDVC